MRQRLLLLVAVLAGLAGFVSACGGGVTVETGSPVDPVEPPAGRLAGVRTAIEQTAAAPTGRMRGSARITGATGPITGDFEIPFEGAYRVDGDFSFTVDLADIGDAAVSALAQTDAGAIAPMLTTLFGDLEVRRIGETAYLRMPSPGLPAGGGQWLAVAVDGSRGPVDLGRLTPTDPSAILDMLRALDAAVEEVGRETVNGVETTHYHVVVDAAAAAPLLDERGGWPGAALAGEVPFDLWVGDDGLVTRFETVVEGTVLSGGQTDGMGFGALRISYELFDLGADIDLTAPPADQVTDLANTLAGIEDLLGSLDGLDLDDLFGD